MNVLKIVSVTLIVLGLMMVIAGGIGVGLVVFVLGLAGANETYARSRQASSQPPSNDRH